MLSSKIISLSIVCILITNETKQIMIDSKAIMSTDTIKTIESMINIATAYTKYRNIINKKCMDIADKDWSMKHISH